MVLHRPVELAPFIRHYRVATAQPIQCSDSPTRRLQFLSSMKKRVKARTIAAYLLLIGFSGGCARSIDKDLIIAAYDGNVEQVRALVQKGANPNALAVDAWTPLTVAAREGHLEAVKVLLDSGAKIDAPEGGGNTALFWAAFYDHRDVIHLLLSKGADINKKSKGGESPLHLALRFNHDSAADLLRGAGARE
jgi:hypothetical protein